MYGIVQTKIMNKKYANYFGYTYFQILTGSMEDTISIDDMVFVRITKDVKEQDIISYESNNEIITHRIIEEREDGYITQGDNNNTSDGLIKKEQVVGKVVYIGRKYGKVKKFIFEPIVLIPLITSIALFSWYVSLLKKERSLKNEK